MKTYFNMKNPPVKVGKFVIGDGSVNTPQVFELLPAVCSFSSSFIFIFTEAFI